MAIQNNIDPSKYQIRKEIENGERKLDGELFEILLNAEKRQENWSGILDAYELKRQKNPY